MAKTPDETLKSRKRLGLLKQEINLQRHPSVKSLFPETEEKSLINSINNQNSNNNKATLSFPVFSSETQSYNFKRINIITCEHKLNNNETFFIKANPEEVNNDSSIINNKINIDIKNDEVKIDKDKKRNSNKLNISKPLIYGFTEEQKKLDLKITNDMAKGKEYRIIENSFKEMLKK